MGFILKTSIQATEFTENTENAGFTPLAWSPQKVNELLSIAVWFSSVNSVFSVHQVQLPIKRATIEKSL